MRRPLLTALVALLLPPAALAGPARLQEAKPEAVGLDPARLAEIDRTVEAAVTQGKTPGAVVLIARHGKVAYRKAFGRRQTQPIGEPMTADTVFDLASLTKPMATATAVMQLVERGKLRLGDRVADHLPGFGKRGKKKVTVEQLLLHVSGLLADNAVADYDGGRTSALAKINDLGLVSPPGERFRYSDVGYIVLGELVGKASGTPLDAYAAKNIFGPLGLRDTQFRPAKDLAARAAPTEKAAGRWLRGEVHDPRARRLGGVAGHAGLFSTADEVAVFAQVLLDGGAWQGRRVLTAETVRRMTAPRRVPGGLRALGWDVQTAYSHNRGEAFGGFGHTGFTGTSLWVDPPSRTLVVVLTNRVHPDGKGNVVALRRRVATLAAAAIVKPPFPEKQPAAPRKP
jgi:CubicO group peptidase (beta-lactamase class C family)